MKRILFLAMISCVTALAFAQQSAVPPELLGSWDVDPNSVKALGMPASCNASSLRLESTGDIEYTSGNLRYKSKASIKRDGSGFEIFDEPYENNGQLNCQGQSAQYYFSHYAPSSYVVVQGANLRMHLFGKNTPIVLVYVRRMH